MEDDVIARHRARLEEHRKFLENCAASSSPDAKSNVLPQTAIHQGAALAAENDALSPQPVEPGRQKNSSSSPPYSPISINDARNPNKFQRCRSADHTAEEARMQRSCETSVNQASAPNDVDSARHMGARRLRSRSEGRATDNVFESRQSFSAPAVPFFGYTGIQDRLAEEDHFFETQLRATGRYYVTSPDAMYVKSKMWLEGRERSRRQLVEERMRESFDECSFQPKIKTLEGRRHRSYSMRAAPSLCDDPSVSAHLERLEEARQQRAEVEQRMKGKTAGTWTNQLTVPKAFEFAKRVTAIPALRKPLTNAIPLHDDDAARALHAGGGPTGGGAGGRGNLWVPTARRQKKPEEVKKEGRHAAIERNVFKGVKEAITTHTVSPLLTLNQTILHLNKELAEKNRVVQEQKGEIALLRRQLEAAKAVVQRLSMQDIS